MQLNPEIKKALTSKGISFDEELIKIPFFENHSSQYSFTTFLVKQRIRPCQILQILREIGLDEYFLLAYEKVSLCEHSYNDDQPDISEDLGPKIIEAEFSGDEVFQSILGRFGILQIMAEDLIQQKLESNIMKDSNTTGKYITQEGELIISKKSDFIISHEAIYVSNEELAKKIQSIITLHTEEFQELLTANLNKVSHEIYINWFIKWFPGLVHIRTLN